MRYCLDQARNFDRDRLLTILFVPKSVQQYWLTLICLNIELEGVAESVTEPVLGHVRFQWWYDRISDLKGDISQDYQHPLLNNLNYMIAQTSLTCEDLLPLIAIRDEFDLESVPFQTIHDLEKYLYQTAGRLQTLWAKIMLGASLSSEIESLASRVGYLYGLMKTIKRIPLQVSHKRCLIPKDILIEHNITEYSIFQNPFTPNGASINLALLNQAAGIEESLLPQIKQHVNRSNLSLFLLHVLSKNYMGYIDQCQGQMNKLRLYSHLKKQWHLTMAWIFNRL